MLVFTRKVGQAICLPGTDTTITIAKSSRSRVTLSVNVPPEVRIYRGELPSPVVEDVIVEGEANADSRPAPKSRARRAAPTTVLLAIADRQASVCYADAFRAVGYRPIETTDGLSCLSALRLIAVDLLVVDRHLLWGSGDGVVEVMHQEPAISPVPVVLMDFPSFCVDGSRRSDDGVFGCDEIVQIIRRYLAEID